MQSEKPPYQIRKEAGEWFLRKWVVFQEHTVLCLLGTFTHWEIAMLAGQADYEFGGLL